MNILFLTIIDITDINSRGIYLDLVRRLRDEGHQVYIVSPCERRFKQRTKLTKENGMWLLKVRTLNIQKTNVIEKGIGILFLEYQFSYAIKRYFADVKFDMVLYSTPPITLVKVIEFIKKRDNAIAYLLLKDIFPQNAVDLGLMNAGGILHRYFRHKEKKLYKVSDYIGCMSPANVSYLIQHNNEINTDVVEVNPNSIEPCRKMLSPEEKLLIKSQHDIPENKTIFIYGGNLGKPQGLGFLISVLEANDKKTDCFFIIVGTGTEFVKIQKWFETNKPTNAILLSGLLKYEYDHLVQSCDVGMIFLDRRFTIPNFPSRLLSYLEYKMPVIASTDRNTDLGQIIEENDFGFWCESGDLQKINQHIDFFCEKIVNRQLMGENGYRYLLSHYTTKQSYEIIMDHFKVKAENTI